MSEDAYARHLASPRYRDSRAEKAEVILALCGPALRDAERIGDLGAGTGLIKNTLEIMIDKYIVGIEIDEEFIVHHKGMVRADVRRLPARDESFDFLLLNHIYEHVPDPGRLFGEAFRVLRDGGSAYVSAGNRLAVREPHYRLPFLSWLPGRAADLYLRLSGRGERYEGIRFLTYGPLTGHMAAAGFEVQDITETALERLIGEGRGGRWRTVWGALSAVPRAVRRALLRALSPQWFFLLRRPADRIETSAHGTGG